MSDDPQSAAAIREALMRMNEAENDLSRLGVERVIGVIDEIHAVNWESGGDDQPPHGRAEEHKTERAFFTAFPDYHRTFHNVVVEPPFAAFRWTMTGTHEGRFFGVPATGRAVRVSGMSMAEFEAGRVRRSWVSLDFSGLMGQLRGPSEG
jgi:predicted ester cyclase